VGVRATELAPVLSSESTAFRKQPMLGLMTNLNQVPQCSFTDSSPKIFQSDPASSTVTEAKTSSQERVKTLTKLISGTSYGDPVMPMVIFTKEIFTVNTTVKISADRLEQRNIDCHFP
jgi:hypothetical protein